MSKSKFTDSIEVKSPCDENWDEMQGNDKVRFCSHCAKSVNNISLLTRKKAERIVRDSGGNICVRYVKNPETGRPLYAQDLYKITRRAPALAAGVVAATLGISSAAYAQGSPFKVSDRNQEIEKITRTNSTSQAEELPPGNGGISGVVTDSAGAVIPNANVKISGRALKEARQVTSNIDGNYDFRDLPAGTYDIEFNAPAFNRRIVSGFVLTENAFETHNATLEVSVSVTVGLFLSTEPVALDHALSRAVADNDIENVKKLIYRGAGINAREKNRSNATALFLAVENGNLEIAGLLLHFGAKTNVRDDDRRTPLMSLDDEAKDGLVELLVRHGAKLDLVDEEGNTALIYAIHDAELKTVQALIGAGANVNLQNKEGRTALMLAAERDDLEKVRALILAGADVNLKDKEGDTAWDLTSDAQVEALLEAYGGKSGDPDTIDEDDPAVIITPVENGN